MFFSSVFACLSAMYILFEVALLAIGLFIGVWFLRAVLIKTYWHVKMVLILARNGWIHVGMLFPFCMLKCF
jgi:hypothetical protein